MAAAILFVLIFFSKSIQSLILVFALGTLVLRSLKLCLSNKYYNFIVITFITIICGLSSKTYSQGVFGGKIAVLDKTSTTTFFNVNSQTCDGAGTGNLSSGNATAYTAYQGDKYYLGGNVLSFGFNSNYGAFMQWQYYVVGGSAPGYGTALNFSGGTFTGGVCSSGSNIKIEQLPVSGSNTVQCTTVGNFRLDVNLVGYNNGNNFTAFISGNYIPFTVNALGNPTSCTASITGTTATLGWTRFSGGVNYNVMVVRYAKNASPTAPTNGSSYALNSTIGSGTVVYASGTGTGTTNTVSAATDYDYYFYSENWSYYSTGQKVTALAPATPIITSVTSSVPTSSTTQTYKGATVTVTGTTLGSISTVRLGGSGGTNISSFSASSTQITFVVPDATSSGTVYVSDGTNTYTSVGSLNNLGYISNATTGNWNTTGSWLGNAVPISGSAVTIAASNNITLDVAATVSSLTITGTFTASDNSARTLTISTTSSATTLTNNGTWANGTGGSTVAFSGAPAGSDIVHTIGGSGTIAFNNITISKTGGTQNVGVVFTTNNSLANGGKLTIGNGGYIYSNSNTSFYTVNGSTTLEFSNSGGYVVTSSDATWPSTNSPSSINITAGTVALNYTRTASGSLNISGGGLTLGADLIINGNWTRSTGSFTPSTYKVTLSGSSAQTVDVSGGATMYNLEVNNAAGVNFSTGGLTINDGGTLTLTAGVLSFASTYSLTIGSSGAGACTISRNAGSLSFGTGTIVPTAGNIDITYNNAADIVTGTEFSATNTKVRNLTISSSSTKKVTLNNANTVSGTLTINSGAILADGGYTLTHSGASIANSGTHSGAGKILTSGSGDITITGTSGTFQNLETNRSSANLIIGTDITINGNFTNTAGGVRGTNKTITFTGTNLITNNATMYGEYSSQVLNLTFNGVSTLAGSTGYLDAKAYSITGTLDCGTIGLNSNSSSPSNGSVTISGTLKTANTNGLWNGATTATVRSGNMNVPTISSGSTIEYNASSGSQTISALTYYGLTISGGSAKATASGTTTVNTQLTLTSGVVTTTSSNILSIASTGSISGGSSSSYISGPLSKALTSTSPFTYQIGKGGIYSPVTFTYATTTSKTVTIEQFETGSPLSLSAVSTARFGSRYWNITQSATGVAYTVGLNDGGNTPTGSVVIMRREGTGTVSSNATSFGSNTYSNSSTFSTGNISNDICLGESNIPLTVTGATTSGKVYDRTNVASVTGGSLVGIVSPDVVTLNQSGTFSQITVGNSISITGTCSLSGANSGAYSLTQPTLTARNITALALTVTGGITSNKVYDRTNTASVTGGTLVGIISPDVVTLSQSGTFAQAGVGTSIAITSTSTLGGADAGNYSLTQPTLTARDITVKALTVTGATTSNKVYDRTNTAGVTGGSLVGIISPDVVTLSQSGTFAQTGVGTGVAITSTSSLGGADAGNYSLTQPSLTSRNITALALTVTGATTSNKVYDRTNTASFTGGSLVGIISPDVVTLTQSGTFAQTGVGTGIAITSTSSLGGADAGNYSLTQPSLTSRNITALALTVTGATTSNKTYNGTNTAIVTGGSLVGIISPDVVTLSQSGTYAQTSVGTSIAITSTSSLGGADAGNYSLTQPSLTSRDITTAPLTITGISIANKTFDGLTTATITGTAAYSGLQNGESFTVSGTPTASFVDASIANGKSVTVSGYTAPTSNYSISQPTLTANITSGSAGVWVGNISTDYTTAANWADNTVPTSGQNVTIPSGTTYAPTVAGTTGTSTIFLNGNTLTINGSISSGTTISSSIASSLVLGSSASGNLTFATGTGIDSVTNGLTNLTVSGSVTLATPLHIYGKLDVPNGGTFNVNDKNLVLHSNASYGTASVGKVNATGFGTLSGATNVSVQRYHYDSRSWAFLTTPLTVYGISDTSVNHIHGDIKSNWQKYTYITGPVTTGGLDAAGNNNYSLYRWLGNSGWTTYSNTSDDYTLFDHTGAGTVADNKAYMIFLRGDRSISPAQGLAHTAVQVVATGALQTGNLDYTLPVTSPVATKYALIGNPYAAPIDLYQFAADNTSLQVSGTLTVYFWDTHNSGTGGYTTGTYSGSSWAFTGYDALSNPAPQYIQSGQAFFVSTNGQSTAHFKESHKAVNNSNNNTFGNNPAGKISVNMRKGTTYIDGVLGLFDNSYSTTLVTPGEDAGKFWGNEEGIGLLRTSKFLSIEARPEISGDDTMFLYMNKMVAGTTYKFDISGQDLPATVSGYLFDKYLNTQTPLNLTQHNNVSFTIDTAAASKSATRFMIVFNSKAPLYASEIKVKASVKAKAAVIDWTVSTEKDVDHYSVESSKNGKDFSAINNTQANNRANSAYSYTDNQAANGDNYYRIKAISKDGSVQYSNIAKVTIGDRREGISIYPNPVVGKTMNVQLSNVAAGNYEIVLYNANGQQVMEQSLQHAGGSITTTMNLPSNLASGIYQLKIGKFIETVIVK